MTSLAIEYKRWDISMQILQWLLSKSNKKYEIRNVYERYLLNSANISTDDAVFTIKPLDHFIYKNMIRELQEKQIVSNKKKAIKIAKHVQYCVNKFFELPTKKAPKIIKKKNLFICGNFSRKISINRLSKWQDISKKVIMKMLLRYSSMALGGQQWHVPSKWYKWIIEKYDADIEGFASPLNSQLVLYKKNPKFGSLFIDTDKPFGSIGNIFDVDSKLLRGKTMVNNPPFVLEIMDKLCKYQHKLLAKIKLRIILIVPEWRDTYYYKKSMKSKYLVCDEYLSPNNYYYETESNSGKKIRIIARFGSHVFVLSSFPNESPKKYKDITKYFKL